MASTVDQQLLEYITWPQDTLHSSQNGRVVGFLMSKVTGCNPIHKVYSPAHRRQELPKATWRFLLYVARNTAAAIEALHTHGHVLGDVNQGNVMVGTDSKVVIIDSDSIQVNARGTLHLCEVGVAHFTPPELQGLSSFQGFTRTANHDNFGLALLVFHILFGGRHPYSGVPLQSGVGEALETDIKGFRYAYAKDAQSRGIAPPPRSIPTSLVPASIQAMFERAFTEKGITEGRPTARQWKEALHGMLGHLKTCSTSQMHAYPDHLPECPWCSLERQGVVYFIDLGTTYRPTSPGFVLTQTWALIEAVPVPPSIVIPNISGIPVIPTPIPSSVTDKGSSSVYRFFIILFAIAGFSLFPKIWFVVLIATWIFWVMAGSTDSSEREQERRNRKGRNDEALRQFNALIENAKKETGPEHFNVKREGLKTLRNEYQELSFLEKKELDKLYSTAQDRQKKKFLERFFIDSSDIPGVGPTRKATLRSFGIETAADISKNRILQIRGFGDSLTRALTDWKASCERKFVFNSSIAVPESDKNIVRAKFDARKVALETTLSGGAAELQRLRQMVVARATSFQPSIDQAAKKLAQTQSDLTLF